MDAESLDPWLFPSAEWYRGVLERNGFEVSTMLLFPRPTVLATDLSGWLETFAQAFLAPFDAGARRAIVQEVTETVRPGLYDAERGWTVDYVRLRFSATRPRSA